jgi:hypothetical protein
MKTNKLNFIKQLLIQMLFTEQSLITLGMS